MSIYGKNFYFNGQSSSDFNIALCDFESPSNTRETGLSLTINKGTTTPNRPYPNYYTSQYTDVFKFSISFMKCTNEPFTQQEYRQIVQWLYSAPSYALFYIEDYDDSDYHKNVEYFAKCTGLTEFGVTGTVYGFTASMECNAPYGFSKELSAEFSASSGNNAIITIDNTSDEISYDYYPIIEVECSETGKVQFINANYTDEIFTVQMNKNQKLVIDNQLGTVEDSLELFDYSTDTNLKWLHLAPGSNQITVIGNATGAIKCRYPRKVGI